VTIEIAGRQVEIAERPDTIISLSPTATEMLFAIGAGDQVEAVDKSSNFPADAPVSDLDGIAPNTEAMLGYQPDLVILNFDPSDVTTAMDAAGVPTITLPTSLTLDDSYAQIKALGDATGHPGEADALVAQMRSDIEALAATVPDRTEPLSYYHELDSTLFTVTSNTFVGEIYALAGLANIADPADADGAAGGYPQLSAEFLIDADPDLIFLADTKCCAQSAAAVAERPGWSALAAVEAGNVIELDDDVASRWGPRVVEFLETIIDAAAVLEQT
jgi:iron complex transport system substrate-binding protein